MASSLLSLINKHTAEKAARNQSFRPESFPDGDSKWRILPHASELAAELPEKQMFQDYAIHYMKIPGNDEYAIYVCEMETFGRPCDVCEEVKKGLFGMSNWDKVSKTRSPKPGVSKEILKTMEEMRSTPRILVNALRTDVANQKPVVLGLPKKVWEEMVAKTSRRFDNKGVLAFSAAKGVDFFVSRKGTGIGTKYEIELDTDTTAVTVNPSEMANLADKAAASADDAKRGALEFVGRVTGKPVAALQNAGGGGVSLTYVAPAAGTADAGPSGAFATASQPIGDEPLDVEYSDIPESVDSTKREAVNVAAPAADLHANATTRATTPSKPASFIDPSLLAELDSI